jgi:hypothetical protein
MFCLAAILVYSHATLVMVFLYFTRDLQGETAAVAGGYAERDNPLPPRIYHAPVALLLVPSL